MIDQECVSESITVSGKRRVSWQRFMRLVRRIHLYSGLFMVPWVLLYGITAFLFNHPQAFSDEHVRRFGSSELKHTPMSDLPSPASVADEVVQTLQAKAVAEGRTGAAYRLAFPAKASFGENKILALVRGDGNQYLVELDLVRGTGTVQSRGGKGAEVKARFAAKDGIRMRQPLPDRFQESLPELLSKLDVQHEETTLVLAPELNFWMEGDGKLWQVSYNMQRGSVTATLQEAGAEPTSWRRFFTRLHLAHGFPDKLGTRWVWAVLVDAMFVMMVLWALSGMLMAWQLKAIRIWGLSALVLGIAAAVGLMVCMYFILVP